MDRELFVQLQGEFTQKAAQVLKADMREENKNMGSRGDGEQTSRNELLAIYAGQVLDDYAEGYFTLDADEEPVAQSGFTTEERTEFVTECVAAY